MKFAKQVNLYCYKENPMQMGLSSTVWANTFGCLQTAHSVLNQGFSYTVLRFLDALASLAFKLSVSD